MLLCLPVAAKVTAKLRDQSTLLLVFIWCQRQRLQELSPRQLHLGPSRGHRANQEDGTIRASTGAHITAACITAVNMDTASDNSS